MQEPHERRAVGIIADDLTGACDAAAPFASRAAQTMVLLDQDAEADAGDVLSWCTATRDVPPEEAAEVLSRFVANAGLNRHGTLFKKIDSTFRGNTFAEISASVQAFPERLAIIAPAFPALGRTCSNATLHRADLSGRHSLPLREPLRAAGLEPLWLAPSRKPESLAAALTSACAIFYEATQDDELTAVVQAAHASSRPLLWIGSGGLAHALAAELYPAEPNPPAAPRGPLLCINGSNHAVTTRQLASLGHHCPTLRIERGITTDAEIVTLAAGHRFRTLMLVGGDTALQVCRALGISRLRLSGEYASGVPQAIACGGPYSGTTIVLKSGGFGAEDLLLRLAQQCGKANQ